MKYTDPTGHRCVGEAEECSNNGRPINGAGPKPRSQPSFKEDKELATYVAAAIETQNPLGIIRGSIWRIKGKNTGIGPAKITDSQMETPWGEDVVDSAGKLRGMGLGLRTGACGIFGCPPGQKDQADHDVAIEAMGMRISLRTNVCKNHGCSVTDVFVTAALAQNESIDKTELLTAISQYASSNGPVIIDWKNYLTEGDPNNLSFNQGLIISFSTNVIELQSQGWYVPDVDWSYVSDLLVTP